MSETSLSRLLHQQGKGDEARRMLSEDHSGVFDNGKHPAWGKMIVPGETKGTFRIAAKDANS